MFSKPFEEKIDLSLRMISPSSCFCRSIPYGLRLGRYHINPFKRKIAKHRSSHGDLPSDFLQTATPPLLTFPLPRSLANERQK